MISARELRKRAAVPERLCDCGRQAVIYQNNNYICARCDALPPASAYVEHYGAEAMPEIFQVHLPCGLEVFRMKILLSMLGVWVFGYLGICHADYAVQSSTNLTEWKLDPIAWDTVLSMVRTNPASPDSPHKYYRLASESEPLPHVAPQGFYSVRWSSNAGDATWDAYVSWPVHADTNVLGYDVQASGNAYSYRRILADRFSTNVVIPNIAVTPRELTVTPITHSTLRLPTGYFVPPAPIKERVVIGDPFVRIQSRRLEWTYDANFTGSFEIGFGNEPTNLVQVGKTQSRFWQITPARLGWFGVRARTLSGVVSKWTTVTNLK